MKKGLEECFLLEHNKNYEKIFISKGFSLTEALVAVVISTIVMGATYTIYSNFQGTFVRQINHNNMKQEAGLLFMCFS